MYALLVEHYLRGAAYPVGGAGRIAATLVPGIEARGGAVVTGAEVAEILVERGRAVGVRSSTAPRSAHPASSATPAGR
jgi:all-trans-retinol 13,14-reductase